MDQRALMLALFDELFTSPAYARRGVDARKAIDGCIIGGLREVVEIFGLLGDPVLEF